MGVLYATGHIVFKTLLSSSLVLDRTWTVTKGMQEEPVSQIGRGYRVSATGPLSFSSLRLLLS